MANTPVNTPGANQKFQDHDNQRQQQNREAHERKQSGQSGAYAGRNNHSPRKGDKGERHQDNSKSH